MIVKIDKDILINEHRIQLLGPHKEDKELLPNEMVYDLSLIPSGVPKLGDGGIILQASDGDMLEWGMITLDDVKDKLRRERTKAFEAMLIYDNAVTQGDEIQTPEEKILRNRFRREWLDITEEVDRLKTPYVFRPTMPPRIKYYVQDKEV